MSTPLPPRHRTTREMYDAELAHQNRRIEQLESRERVALAEARAAVAASAYEKALRQLEAEKPDAEEGASARLG